MIPTQISTMFYIVMVVVALIWALVIGIAIFNAVRAIKGKKNSKEKAKKTKKTHIQPIAPALDDSTSTPTIAGMPAGAYYATLTNWTIH